MTDDKQNKPIPSRTGKDANPPDGYCVARWPEFVALAKRLGISLDLPWTWVEIRIEADDVVTITQAYHADDIDQQDTFHPTFDITTMHNREYKTCKPTARSKEKKSERDS